MNALDVIDLVPSVAAICFACVVYGARKRLLGKIGNKRYFSMFVDERYLCVLVGVVFGNVSTNWFHELGNLAALAVLFVAGWIGFTIGCGLDIRVLRRSGAHSLLPGFVQTIIALIFVPSFVYGFSGIIGSNGRLANPVSVLCMAAVCVAGSSSFIQRHGFSGIGYRYHLGLPCISGFLSISLIAFTGALLPSVSVDLPASVFWDSQHLVVEGIKGIFLGILLGSMVGFFCDLSSRDGHNPSVLFFIFATFVLLGVGLAQLFGLQPLWVGAFAGLWLINSSLRRLDVLNVVEQSSKLVCFVLPLAVGCLLGKRLATVGVEWESFVFGVGVVILVRPAVKIFTALLMKQNYTIRDVGSLLWTRDVTEFEQLSLMAALVLFHSLDESVGAGIVVGTILGNFFLGVFFSRVVTSEEKGLLREHRVVKNRINGLTVGTDVTRDRPEL